jgi:hypothetical protein
MTRNDIQMKIIYAKDFTPHKIAYYTEMLKQFDEMKKTPSRTDYEEYLNELGIPEDDKHSNGGRIPDHCDYGTWLRVNDPIAFNVGYSDYCR